MAATTAFEMGNNTKSHTQKGSLHHSRSQQSIRQMNSTQPTAHHSWRPFPSSKDSNIPLPPTANKTISGYHKYSTKQQNRTEIDISMTQGAGGGVGGKSETLFGRKMTYDKFRFEGTYDQTNHLNFKSNNDSDHSYQRVASYKPKTSESGLSLTAPGYYSRSPGLQTRASDSKSKQGGTTLRSQLDNMMK